MPPRGGGIQTSTKSNAKAIQKNLKANGVPSTLEKTHAGKWIINYILSFSQLVKAENIVSDLKADKNINSKDMKMDDSIAARVVDIDLKLAMKQAPNVKFSYIDNKIQPEKGIEKLDKYKIKDLDKMEDFFERVDSSKMHMDKSTDDYKQLYNGDDEIEKWWFQQTQSLKDNIEIQFADLEEEYELIGINLLYNSKHATKYLQHKNYENSKLMFHGAKQGDMGSIFQTGFRFFANKTIGKLYGNGHYFTPQVQHAIRYLRQCKGMKNANQFTLIAAFVNPGKIKTVRDFSYKNKSIKKGYDCHYVKVTDGVNKTPLGLATDFMPGYNGDVMEEYAIRDTKRVKKVFVWRDKNIGNQFNGSMLKKLKGNCAIYGVTDTDTAIHLVKNKVYVVTNGAHDGEGFVRRIRKNLQLKTDILVFCQAVDWHSKWAKKFVNVQVGNGKSCIVSFIGNH